MSASWACGHTYQFSSVAQSCPTLCDPMDCSTPRLPCTSPTPRIYSNSYPLSRWCCHPTISSSVIPFSSCLQSLPALESFPRSGFFASGGQRYYHQKTKGNFPPKFLHAPILVSSECKEIIYLLYCWVSHSYPHIFIINITELMNKINNLFH